MIQISTFFEAAQLKLKAQKKKKKAHIGYILIEGDIYANFRTFD